MAQATTPMGCWVCLRRPLALSRLLGYRALPMDGCDSPDDAAVTVVVGKEKKVFTVDPFVLEKDPFRVLLEMMMRKEVKKRGRREEGKKRKRGLDARDVIFVDVDAILFEHLLWLVHNDSSSASLFEVNLKDIIEFYSQDY